MAKPDFYNDNAFRAYPLVGSPDVTVCFNVMGGVPLLLPHATLIDFGCVIGQAAEFDESQDYVYLAQILRTATLMLEFRFRSLCPGLENLELVFSRSTLDGEYVTSYAEATLIDGQELTTDQEVCGSDPLWEGYLVTGNFAELLETLNYVGASVNHTSGDLDEEEPYPRVEPARIQNLRATSVRSITVGNYARTAITAPAGCPGIANAFHNRVHINSSCIVGDIKFTPGYNCSIRQDDQNSALTFSAGVGAGLGEPCEEIKIVEDEVSPDNGQLLTGGPTCGEVMKSINGLSAEGLSIVAGTGVRVLQVGDSELTIDFDLHDLQACILSDIDEETPPDDGYGDDTFISERTLIPDGDVAVGDWFVVQGEGLGQDDPPATDGETFTDTLNDIHNSGGPAWSVRLNAGPPSAFVVSLGNYLPEPIEEFINVVAVQIRLTCRTFLNDVLELTVDILDSANTKLVSTVSLSAAVNAGNSGNTHTLYATSAGLLGSQTFARWAGARFRVYANKAEGGDTVAVDVSTIQVLLSVREEVP